jgi:hypothetical protein
MSPSLSISSSDAARYLGLVLLAALIVVSGIAGISLIGIEQGLVTWKEAKLLRHQLDKIEAAPRVDVLLVGDSTLGNAIDAQAWSRESGKTVLSPPLTGDYGYGGTLNMLRRVLRRHRPELVVVFQTPDMMRRKLTYDGLMYTAETLADIRGIPPWRLLGPLASWQIPISMLVNGLSQGDPDGLRLAGDYVPQQADPARARANVRRDARLLTPAMVHPQRAVFLDEIGALCARERLSCLYAHGPYVEPECRAIGPYLQKVDALIRKSGLTVVPGTPVCMPLADVGDSADHVAPPLKQRYSELYRALIETALSFRASPEPAPAPRAPAGLARDEHPDSARRLHQPPLSAAAAPRPGSQSWPGT